jgi:RNA 2',3'-cyclic 3'-phosphodiesterase
MPELSRYFLALVPDAAARAALAALPLPPEARAVAAEDLHLTLVFLGSLCERSEAEVLQAIGPAPSLVPVSLDRLAYWPGPRVLCAAASVAADLERIVTLLRERLVAAGFAVDEKSFQPHVTLARKVRLPANFAESLVEPVCWQPMGIHLMASLARSSGRPIGGPRYLVRGVTGFAQR